MFENFNRWKHLLIGALVVVAFMLLHFYTLYKPGRNSVVMENQDVFAYFGTDDGLDITWYHRANTLKRLQEALSDDSIKMIEADVIFGKQSPNDKELIPVMGHAVTDVIDLTTKQFIDQVILHKGKKGIKLDFKDIEAVEPTLKYIESKQHEIKFPVWLNADTTPGPGAKEAKVDGERFVQLCKNYCPDVTLSLGFMYLSPSNTPLSQAMVRDIYALAAQTTQPVTFAINVAMFASSLSSVSWLLHQDPARFSVTLWTSIVAKKWEGANPGSICKVRKELSKKMLFYDLSVHEDTWQEFLKICQEV